jgi:ABC-type transport system involved in multi-copper enzyme maturation permease subunit
MKGKAMDQGATQSGGAAERPEAAPAAPAAIPAAPSGLDAVRRVFMTSALEPVRRKRGLILFILTLLPVILIVAADIFGAERGHGSRFFVLGIASTYHYIEVLVYIFLGCAVLGEGIENRTMTYDLVCPISRGAIFAGRYLTYIVSALILVLPALTISYFVCMFKYGWANVVHSLPLLWAVLVGAVLAAFVYGSAFMFMSLVTRRAVLAAVLLTICAESFVANLPLRLATYSALFHLRNIMAAISDNIEFFPVPPQINLVVEALDVTAGESALVLVCLCAGFTYLSARFFSRKQFP